MWPFSRKPKLSLEEWAATKPLAPCGYQKEHFYWTEIEGWPCPKCARIEREKQKSAEEDRMAEKVALAVVRQLHARGYTE